MEHSSPLLQMKDRLLFPLLFFSDCSVRVSSIRMSPISRGAVSFSPVVVAFHVFRHFAESPGNQVVLPFPGLLSSNGNSLSSFFLWGFSFPSTRASRRFLFFREVVFRQSPNFPSQWFSPFLTIQGGFFRGQPRDGFPPRQPFSFFHFLPLVVLPFSYQVRTGDPSMRKRNRFSLLPQVGFCPFLVSPPLLPKFPFLPARHGVKRPSPRIIYPFWPFK